MKRISTSELVSKVSAILIGEFICAFAITQLLMPYQLLSGGVGGISIILQYVTKMNAGIFVFLINLPLFFIGLKFLNTKFTVFSFFSAIVLSIFVGYLQRFTFFQQTDMILICVFGGFLNGLGMGIMFRYGTCQGGLDIIAAIARKRWHVEIGSALLAMNGIIILIGSFLFGVNPGLYTLISMFVAYQIVDRVIVGFDKKKQFLIISKKSEEIAREIFTNPHRGVTILKGEGAYTKTPTDILYCIAASREVAIINRIINQIDPTAFVSISDMSEVQGKGFKSREI